MGHQPDKTEISAAHLLIFFALFFIRFVWLSLLRRFFSLSLSHLFVMDKLYWSECWVSFARERALICLHTIHIETNQNIIGSHYIHSKWICHCLWISEENVTIDIVWECLFLFHSESACFMPFINRMVYVYNILCYLYGNCDHWVKLIYEALFVILNSIFFFFARMLMDAAWKKTVYRHNNVNQFDIL